MKNKIFGSVVALAVSFGAGSNVQAALPAGPVLDFADGIGSCQFSGVYPDCEFGATTVREGSYFAVDTSGNAVFEGAERIPMVSAGTGITLDYAQGPGEIDIDWNFGGLNGRHLTKNPLTYVSTGVNTYEINMSGWTVNWGSEGDIDMGAGAPAILTCDVDCAEGDNFILDYTAFVPEGAFAGVGYALHLEGVIASAVPVPAAVWLFGSGLLGLAGVARRRRAS